PQLRVLGVYQSQKSANRSPPLCASTQFAPTARATATRTTSTRTTPWTLYRHVIPNIPLCFSNYARSCPKYGCVQPYLCIIQSSIFVKYSLCGNLEIHIVIHGTEYSMQIDVVLQHSYTYNED